jgi:RNA polymerase sigma-70 factor (ECF subfamily)
MTRPDTSSLEHLPETARPAPVEHPTVSSLLLDGIRQMDPVAWSRLVDTFGGVVYGWCRASGLRPQDASDIVQDVFASVARGIGSFQRQKAEGSFRSWLATITRNRVRDHFRKQADREVAIGGTEALRRLEQQADDFDSTISPEGINDVIVRRVLDGVRAEFEPATWNAFWMSAVDGKSAAEITAETGMSAVSVYQAKSRVLKRLRQRLSELPP